MIAELAVHGFCLICGRSVAFVDGDPYTPEDATRWTSNGNYGSTLIDMIDGRHVESYICDSCLRDRQDRVLTVEPGALREHNRRFKGIVQEES